MSNEILADVCITEVTQSLVDRLRHGRSEILADVCITEDHVKYLCTPDFALIPYEAALWQGDILSQVWATAENEGTLGRIFWWQHHIPEARRVSLSNFVNYFHGKILFILIGKKDERILGFVWFYDIEPDQAHTGYWYSRKAWRERCDDGESLGIKASRVAASWGFEAMGWQQIWGKTPWRFAVAHVKRLGAVCEAIIPDFAMISGRRMPVYILRHTRSAFLRDSDE